MAGETGSLEEERRLVEAARGGDTGAFEGLVRRHQNSMFTIAFHVVGGEPEACEVVQDSFVAAYRNLRNFRGESKFSTWLTAIVLNRSRNRLRRLVSRRAQLTVSLEDSREIPSEGSSVLDVIEREELRQRVRRCVGVLDLEFREVIVLRDLQDRSYAEIGETLKLPIGTVRSRISRAREAVRACLKRSQGGG